MFNLVTRFVVIVFSALFLIGETAGPAQARQVERESDCRDSSACIEEYKRQKTAWLDCLEKAGLSEKKRSKLAARVEMLGIRNLKKQEFLIFNSARKACHKQFKESLGNLPREETQPKDWPPPLDNLTDRLPSRGE